MRSHSLQLLRQHADLRWLVLGTFATQAGQWALTIGMGWLMLGLTDSAFQVGLLSFAGGLPMLLAALPAGLLLDRIDRRRVMLVAQALIVLLLLSAVPMLLVFPYLHLLPVFARDVLRIGSDGLALLMAVSGAGALVGGLLTARVAATARPGRGMLLLVIVYGGFAAGFANAGHVATALPMMVLASVCAALYMSLNATLLQLQVADAMRGRVTGIHQLTYALFLLGALPMGALADLIGVPGAVTIGAMLSSAVAVFIAVRAPHLWRLGGSAPVVHRSV